MSEANELFRNWKFLIFDSFPKENWREQEIIFPANCSHTFAEYEELRKAIPKETKLLLRAENYFVLGDIKMQPQYPEQYPPQQPPQYYQPPPPQAPPYPYPPPYRPPSPIWGQIFSGKGIAALIIVLIAGILITVGLCGAWCAGINVKQENTQACPIPSDSKGRGIGDIQNDYSNVDSLNPTEGSGNGAKYSALYTLIPCSIIVLVFGILCPFTPLFAPHLKKIFAILVIVFSIIAVAISAMGIAFVLSDKVVWASGNARVTLTGKLGYAGVVGIVGGIMGLIGGIFLLPSMPRLRPRYRPQYQYGPQQPPTAPQYYPPQQPPAPPRQYP